MDIEVKAIVLKWARESLKIPLNVAAKKIDVELPVLMAWEAKDSQIPIGRIRKIAAVYKRSFGCFLLDSIPQENDTPPDYRKANLRDNDISTEIHLAIRRAREIQENAIDLEINQYKPSHPTANLGSNPIEVADTFRKYLHFKSEEVYKLPDIRTAYSFWKRLIEEKLGIFVIDISLPRKEVKAFSLNHSVQPMVVVNSKDEDSSKVFSLFHEIYHILLGNEGLCKYGISIYESNETEKLCNKFAASFLVPKEELFDRIQNGKLIGEDGISEQAIIALGRYFKVSRFVILGRLLSFEIVEERFFKEKYDKWMEEYSKKPKSVSGGGGAATYISTVVNNNSLPFSAGVIDSYNQNKITIRDASLLLKTKVKHIDNISKKVRTSYGSSTTSII